MSALEGHGNWKLPPALIALSEGKTWDKALGEWRLNYIEHLEEGEDLETCLCTHYTIREVCHIVNDANRKTAIVGNCCVTRFEGDTAFAGTHKIFGALKRIREDKEASANEELIQYAYDNDIFDEAAYDFYMDIWRKRNLTDAQWLYKRRLNTRLVNHITRKKKKAETQVAAVAAPSIQDALNALRANPTKLADKRLVVKAHADNILSVKDHQFYMGLWERNVRFPSAAQQNWLNNLNTRMLQRLRV